MKNLTAYADCAQIFDLALAHGQIKMTMHNKGSAVSLRARMNTYRRIIREDRGDYSLDHLIITHDGGVVLEVKPRPIAGTITDAAGNPLALPPLGFERLEAPPNNLDPLEDDPAFAEARRLAKDLGLE